jgi:hypothetical protein
MTEFASCWGLLMGSLLIAAPVIFFKIKDHCDVEEDLRFSDETAQDVNAIPLEEAEETSKKEERRVSVVA